MENTEASVFSKNRTKGGKNLIYSFQQYNQTGIFKLQRQKKKYFLEMKSLQKNTQNN